MNKSKRKLVPKKDMLETLARRKEAEETEKKKEEEDERLRKKAEEEQLRQEELERQAEEEKKIEKEKLSRKPETDKQKEGDSLPSNGVPAKRPIYSTKKSKRVTVEANEIKPHSIVDQESTEVSQADKAVVEHDDGDEEDWDAKSWDDPDPELDLHTKSVVCDVEVEAVCEIAKPIVEKKKEISNDSANLRSPILCIMGHVDAGKTKILDCIRGTNVQEGEAGGITQQIGATYIPARNIRERTRADAKLNVPGLLIIDTPGHEAFSNLRSRGSDLCDIAILVVDIMDGLEPQTIESLNLLKKRNTEFIVALNKVDRLFGWKTCYNSPIQKALKQQSKDVQIQFNQLLERIITQFKEQGLNTDLYYKNTDMKETFNIVPTSAISGEGIPDLLLLLVYWTQKTMVEKLTLSSEIQCTVLEVKVVEGHGTTIDVVLVNGVLNEGDQIVVCGMQVPIVTTIRALLTPRPMKELRVKGSYLHHKKIQAAQGIKITAQGLEHAIAGTCLYVVRPGDNIEDIKKLAMKRMEDVMNQIDKSGEGVYVQASTHGSLEALVGFLKTPEVNIPVRGTGIGPVHKKDLVRSGVMLEKRKKEFATILAFDVKVTPEAREYANEMGVKIFTADVIYKLFDQFKAYIQNLKKEQKKEVAEEAVFPCVLKILPDRVYRKKNPILLGVGVLEGIAKVGTPICIPSREYICIGKIASMKSNDKPVDRAKKGEEVDIKIEATHAEESRRRCMADILGSMISWSAI